MVVLALPLLFSPETLTLRAYLTNPPTQRDLLFNALLIAVFYINYYGLIPKLYFNRRYVLFLMINIASFFAINLIASFPGRPGGPLPVPHQGSFTNPHQAQFPGPHHSFFMDISQHLFTFLVVMFLALLLKIRERLKQTEREKLQAELSYLRAQINPHFLFNILNGIYALTIERSDKAPDAVIKLSGMMRYILDESGKEMVALEKELDYIHNYIALQESRFGPTIRLDYHIDRTSGSPTGQPAPASSGPLKIAPLILIPFIENAFKHGVNPEEDSEIRIHLTVTAPTLHMEVFNKKVHVRHSPGDQGRLGIANTRRRLSLLYPHDHSLRIEDNKDDFRVFVTLRLAVASPPTQVPLHKRDT